jgi:hypothetical protein
VTFQTKRTYDVKVDVRVIEPIYPPIPERINKYNGKRDYANMMNDLAICEERFKIKT